MNHNIEQFGDQAAFVSQTLSAWHRLGTVFGPDEILTSEVALKTAHLTDWNVRKSPLYTHVDFDGVVSKIIVPDKFAMIRDNPFRDNVIDVLGVVGNYYTPIQNEEHAALLNALVDESNGRIETAGSLDGGKKIFITIKLPEAMSVGGFDNVDLFIVAINSHDGNGSFEFIVTPIRVVCQNTLTAALRGVKSRFKIRHTVNAKQAIEEARRGLGLTWAYAEEFEKEAEKLIQQSLTDTQFEQVVRGIWTEPEEDGRGKTLWTEKFDSLVDIYHNDETQTGITGTAWGGYQAVTRYLDHVAPVAGEKNEKNPLTVEQITEARAKRTTDDARFEAWKNEAFQAFSLV